MDKIKFRLWNRITALAVFLISAVTYLSTIEPSASYWDCGEFIASSYKLEVGHPPGNPVFQLIARLFTIPGDNMHAAVLVNSMSALCSALTIFFLYLAVVFFAKRIFAPGEDGRWKLWKAVAVFGSGAVGALIYCFSDTFWFSAVEGEVYAMSSLFTAMVFWAMTKWYEVADEPHANRWIVLISFLMGLSIGVHLLNLLTIPALVFIYYYRKRKEPYTFWQIIGIFAVSAVILAVILFGVIPWLPKLAAYCDLFFVNVLGLGYNSGAAFFMIALLALCFVGLFITLKKDKVLANTIMLCLTSIIIGFSLFSICIIRSSVKTPTNEYQPDNAFTLCRYLSREQYGSTPLLYGQYFDAPYELKSGSYWAPIDGKYVKSESPIDAKYLPEGKMLFPRMWSSSPDGRNEDFYESYMNGKGKRMAGRSHRKPTMGSNLAFFFDYQLDWMYWRYFMWNFVGRQNEVHAPNPDELFHGNWESGIGPIDRWRLGDQRDAPKVLSENPGKNHYYFLPLLLGLFGLFWQYRRDKRGCWLVFLLFFMTGIAIVVYLNQPPYQVRERDYAYAGSFYAFSIWCGLGVAALISWLNNLSEKGSGATSVVATVACLCVPALMAAQNWDDHDRSNRRTAVEMAYNYLNSVGENGILITHGDNDTFPLWYAQEVEEIRPDVRICNTSLLGTDWHIDQMKYAVNKSAPLDLKVPYNQYLYGTNEYIYVIDSREQEMSISDVMAVFRHPEIKAMAGGGRKVDYICSRKIVVPVNKENALKSGIVPEKFADLIQDSIVLEIPEDRDMITKPELFMLDLLSNYQWDRPIHMLNQGGDLGLGLRNYLLSDGYSTHLVPFRNNVSSSSFGDIVDTDHIYELMTNVFHFDALARDDYFVDYQNMYTQLGVMPLRSLFESCAKSLIDAGENKKAVELLDYCQIILKDDRFPLDAIPVGFPGSDYAVVNMVDDYMLAGEPERARSLAVRLANELLQSSQFYLQFYSYAKDDFETCGRYIYFLTDTLRKHNENELAQSIEDGLTALLKAVTE